MSSGLELPPERTELLLDRFESPPEPTPASLVSGILDDLKSLIEQQFRLTRMQIEAELRQRLMAAAVFGAGVVVIFVATIFGCFSISHLLHWLASPAGTDPATYPLWMCHAAVGGILGVTGVIMASAGLSKFRLVRPFQNPINGLFQETTQ